MGPGTAEGEKVSLKLESDANPIDEDDNEMLVATSTLV
jgi:hypothetical protein